MFTYVFIVLYVYVFAFVVLVYRSHVLFLLLIVLPGSRGIFRKRAEGGTSAASRRGRDKRGHRRSAAIPPNELSWQNACKMWQHVIHYYKM